jgi:ribosomal protein S18 acetylase RimI-like enzyme
VRDHEGNDLAGDQADARNERRRRRAGRARRADRLALRGHSPSDNRTVRTPLTLRVAEASDSGQLAALDAFAWPTELQVMPPQPADAPFFTTWRDPSDVIVADCGGIVGYVRLGRHMKIAANDHVLHVEALVVAAEARGQGLGGQLLDEGIREARRRGVAKLGLRVLSNNPGAVRLYRGRGFEEEGRLRSELRRADGSYADDIWMALWLRPLA